MYVLEYYFNYRFSEGNQIPIPFTFLSKNIVFCKISVVKKFRLQKVGVAAVFLLIKVVSKFDFGHFLDKRWKVEFVFPKIDTLEIIHQYQSGWVKTIEGNFNLFNLFQNSNSLITRLIDRLKPFLCYSHEVFMSNFFLI